MSRDARLLVCLTTIIICSLLFAFMPKVRTTTFREPAEIVRRTEDAAIAATATAKDIAAPPVLAERQRSLVSYLRWRSAIPARGGATRATTKALRKLRRRRPRTAPQQL